MASEREQAFYVQCTGQIESGEFGGVDDIYCRYAFHLGHDWSVAAGIDTGLSQTSRKMPGQFDGGVVWNFPIDVTFKSTNVYGWPRIAISVYGLDFLGRDVVRGYGSVLVPLTPGQHILEVDSYTPVATSAFNQAFAWLMGNPPEFFDSKFVCQGDGREVTRVQSTGTVRVKLNITTKNMGAVGYSVGDQAVQTVTA
jgi:B9 domain-containing protein 1